MQFDLVKNQVLSDSWAVSTLGEICDKPEYGWTTKAVADAGGLKLLRTTDISKGPIDWSTVPFCEQEPPSPEKYLLSDGDIVISRAGSVGLSALIQNCPEAVFASYLIRFRAKAGLDKKYLHYFLSSPSYWEQIAQESAGIALQNVNAKKLSGITIPLPPLAEQRRIVDAIETQFARLDASVAALRRAQANLRRYRASVLRDACEGRLVPAEAELALLSLPKDEGREYEPAAVLLERVLAERRARWESPEKRRGKYKEPSAPDASALPPLPEGWAWATLSQISELKGGVTKGQRYRDGEELREIPYLRVANVQLGYLDLQKLSTIETTQNIIDQLRLIPGDVLFTEGGDRDKLGRGWVWQGEVEECIHQNHVFRARLFTDDVIPEMVSWWGNSFGRDFFAKYGKQTTNLASINLGVLSDFPIPLPPLAEQGRIVAEVERRLSVVQQAEATVAASLSRAERLRQSILKQAFSGRLVPQDPGDEPASALLERIRAEREGEAAAARAAKRESRRGR